ncbi:DUF3841 domain-containing protein [Paenibacillus silvae]|uniref:DUF3841 domain-containing protein n=1 Tax=Paenibacillus silvae TaxID=1325358 RepID=UPI003CFB1ACA
MRFWSIQTIKAWEKAQVNGYLVGSPEHYMIPEKYSWMIEQMQKRLKNYDGSPPIWVWTKKPDLRQTCHVNTGINSRIRC